jgi:triacylglycerol lipase
MNARRRLGLVVVMSLAVASCRLPMPPIPPGGLSNLGQSLVPAVVSDRSAATPVPSPVVIVPGWAIGCLHGGSGEWDAWTKEVAERYSPGPGVFIFAFDACAPNADTAAGLDRFIADTRAQTGAAKVRLVAISMGSLAARWCLRFGGCASQVAAFASMAGANHGTFWAGACPAQFWSEGCADMAPEGPFLAALNAGSEVPAGVPVGTWNSFCDGVIIPYTSTFLAGADNHDVRACVGHDGWKYDRTQIAAILDWFDAVDPVSVGSGTLDPIPTTE